mgnify:CR=1 FL=1
MPSQAPILGVYLSESLDLDSVYGEALRQLGDDVVLRHPHEIENPSEVRFAICWQPGEDAFAPYPNLTLAMSIGAGVDALLSHPGLSAEVQVARVRDPHQAYLMAGFAAHEVLHREREFAVMADHATRGEWQPLAMRAPEKAQVAVLGHGSMGRAVVSSLATLGFSVTVACRSEPAAPVPGVRYLSGDAAVMAAADGAAVLETVERFSQQTPDYEGVLAELLGYLQQIAIAQTLPAAVDEHLDQREAVLELAQQMQAEDVQLYYQIGLIGRRDLQLAPDLRGGLEMTLLRMLAFRPAEGPDVPATALVAKQPTAASAGAASGGASITTTSSTRSWTSVSRWLDTSTVWPRPARSRSRS